MAQFLFGSGHLWGTPLTDANGNAVSNGTPVKYGTMQDCALDIEFDTKMLYGQAQFAVAAGRGKGKVTGKAKVAQVNGAMINSIFFGQTLTSGAIVDYLDQTGAAIPSSPFTITPTPPNSGAWSVDLGVRNSNGVPLTKVASGPTTGQYSVSAGVYTFASADAGNTVYIDYQYTATVAGYKKSVVSNLTMGSAPTFRTDLLLPYQGKTMIWTLNACISSKLGIATKQDDFVIPEFDFQAFADSNGNVMSWSVAE